MSRTNALRKLITHWPGRQVYGRQMLLCRVSWYSSEQGVSMSTWRDYYSGGKGAQPGAETTPCPALHHSVSGLHLLLLAGLGRDAVLGTLTHFAIPWPQDGVPSTELCCAQPQTAAWFLPLPVAPALPHRSGTRFSMVQIRMPFDLCPSLFMPCCWFLPRYTFKHAVSKAEVPLLTSLAQASCFRGHPQTRPGAP